MRLPFCRKRTYIGVKKTDKTDISIYRRLLALDLGIVGLFQSTRQPADKPDKGSHGGPWAGSFACPSLRHGSRAFVRSAPTKIALLEKGRFKQQLL